MNTAVRTLDRPGDSIAYPVPGTRYTVTLTWTEAGQTFTITVDQGTYRLYELGSVHDLVNDPHAETTARQRARQLAAGLRDGMSTDTLAQAVAMAANRQRVLDAPAAQITAEFTAITAEPTLDRAVPDTGHRNTSHLSAAHTSDPMDRIIAAAARNNGRVERCKDARSDQLIALKKRGLVELTYGRRGNTRVITGATLNSAGWRHVDTLKAVA